MKRRALNDPDDINGNRAVKRLRAVVDMDQKAITSSDIEARLGLQRSLCLAMNHIGFHSATPEALDSFTLVVETYIASLIEDVKRRSLACRREQPTPADFSSTLIRFNLPTNLLRPHRHTPISRTALTPSFHLDATPLDHGPTGALPLLSDELSGQPEKDLKHYIPKGFPSFPSLHTYRYTPADGPGNFDVAAPGRIREAAAKSAKEGEDALRKLVRAAKIRNQKEARTVADRDVSGRERYRLWDGAMKGLLHDLAPSVGTGVPSELSADQGMIVNSDTAFSRREVARGGKRAGAGAIAVTNEGKVAG